jgi:two-component system OmpR family sensor kinase
MFRTLYARLSFALVMLLLVVGVIYAFISLSSARYYHQEVVQNLNLDLAKNLVMDRNLVESGRINQAALKETFSTYMVINPSIEIYLLDLDGKILSYSADPGKVKRNTVSLAPIREFLGGKHLPVLGDDPRSHEQSKVFSVTPVPTAESPEGYLYVVLRGEQYDDIERFINENFILRQSGWALLGSLLLGLLAGLVLFYKLTRRLNRLSENMNSFRRSDFSQFVTTSTQQQGDEIDQLATTFDEMAQRIVMQLDDLRHQDRLRRELVANVSHDLRTPVAILHGYLETLAIKDESLSDEEKQNYRQLALQSSERLTHLINELFELTRLEARETTLHCEPFNLAELAQDVMQKFQLQAEEKQISLSVETCTTAPFVYADISLIARVLENLIGNALKFTSHGGITVRFKQDETTVLTSICDTGPGIPPQHLPHIFDRFYQGEDGNSRPQPGGLGLPISQKIIELHESNIGVDSLLGQGSTFYFTLPAAEVKG